MGSLLSLRLTCPKVTPRRAQRSSRPSVRSATPSKLVVLRSRVLLSTGSLDDSRAVQPSRTPRPTRILASFGLTSTCSSTSSTPRSTCLGPRWSSQASRRRRNARTSSRTSKVSEDSLELFRAALHDYHLDDQR